MTISSTTIAPRWIFVGDTVELSSSISLTSTRARYQLTEKPTESQLPLTDSAKPVYLIPKGHFACTFSPDSEGKYTIQIDEERVTPNAPHYSNDDDSVGVESVTPVSITTVYVFVGAEYKRQIGIAPDMVTLTFNSQGRAGPTYGALTYAAIPVKCPQLGGAVTDRAKNAVKDTNVVLATKAIGGMVGPYSYSGTDELIPWDSVIDSDPITSFAWLLAKFRLHIFAPVSGPLKIHDSVPDTTNVISVSPAVVGNTLSLIIALDALLLAVQAHFQMVAGVHLNVDTLHDMSAYPVLGVGATLSQAIARAAILYPLIIGHMMTSVQTPDGDYTTDQVHLDAADFVNGDTPLVITNESAAVDAANLLVTRYNLHRVKLTEGSNPYHLSTTGAGFIGDRPRTMSQFPAGVNELMDAFQAHCLNVNHAAGGAENYHLSIDYGGRMDDLPRAAPSDIETAMNLFEILIARMMTHFGKGADVHGETVAVIRSSWQQDQSGIGAINAAFQDALQAANPSVVPGDMLGSTMFTMLGGCKKG
jgi:hypothetical protein